jgi:two-component sensor histidine kinase
VSFSDYARSLAGDLVKSLPHTRARVAIDFALEDVALPLAVAIPCGLVLNELISNALEHAFTAGAAAA